MLALMLNRPRLLQTQLTNEVVYNKNSGQKRKNFAQKRNKSFRCVFVCHSIYLFLKFHKRRKKKEKVGSIRKHRQNISAHLRIKQQIFMFEQHLYATQNRICSAFAYKQRQNQNVYRERI